MTTNCLANEIAANHPGRGELVFWRLGQSGVVMKTGGRIFYLDAFLSPNAARLLPSPIGTAEATGTDYFLGTHDHADHIDRQAWPVCANASPNAKFLVPALLKEGLASDLGIAPERFIGLDDGVHITDGDVRFTGIASAHERLNRDPQTGQYPCMGVVIEAGGFTVYFPGDTCRYEGLETKLRAFGGIDIAFLPINGRDSARYRSGIIGNMSYQEAAELAGELAVTLAVPLHYDMFTGNTQDPALFADFLHTKFPGACSRVCDIGEMISITKGMDK